MIYVLFLLHIYTIIILLEKNDIKNDYCIICGHKTIYIYNKLTLFLIGLVIYLQAHQKEEITMIQIIAGAKGKGKTKVLLEKVNNEVNEAKGNIVYLDKNNKHSYELSNKIRLINVKDYLIGNFNEFLGFISGIIACDHDLQSIYLDSFLTIAFVDDDNIEHVLQKLEQISSQFNINLCISISLNNDQIPDKMKQNVIVAL